MTACFLSSISVPGLTLCFEALTAVNGTISAGLERNLGFAAAAVTDHSVHLAGSTTVAVLGTTGSAAGGAAAGLILEALLREKVRWQRKQIRCRTHGRSGSCPRTWINPPKICCLPAPLVMYCAPFQTMVKKQPWRK